MQSTRAPQEEKFVRVYLSDRMVQQHAIVIPCLDFRTESLEGALQHKRCVCICVAMYGDRCAGFVADVMDSEAAYLSPICIASE
jgi:hypothetical protein